MREGAEVAVLAGVGIFAEGLAKLAFVSTGMVQLLDLVVRLIAVAVDSGAGDMVILLEIGAPSILVVMVVETHLPLVNVCVSASLPFLGHCLVLKVLISKRK